MATARFRPSRRPKPSAADADIPFDSNDDRASASENGVKLPAPGPFIDSRGNGAAAIPADETEPVPQRRTQRVRARRREGPRTQGDLVGKQGVQGRLLGDRYVRVCRVQSDEFLKGGSRPPPYSHGPQRQQP